MDIPREKIQELRDIFYELYKDYGKDYSSDICRGKEQAYEYCVLKLNEILSKNPE